MAYIDKDGQLQPEYTMFYKDYCAIYPPLNVSGFENVTINGKVYDFQHMFEERVAFKEIGCETPELFTAVANRFIKETQLDFNDKIEIWKNNLSDKLWQRETSTDESTFSINYINPTISTGNISDNTPQDITEQRFKHHVSNNSGISNPELMMQIMAVENIFYSALKKLDELFIGLY